MVAAQAVGEEAGEDLLKRLLADLAGGPRRDLVDVRLLVVIHVAGGLQGLGKLLPKFVAFGGQGLGRFLAQDLLQGLHFHIEEVAIFQGVLQLLFQGFQGIQLFLHPLRFRRGGGFGAREIVAVVKLREGIHALDEVVQLLQELAGLIGGVVPQAGKLPVEGVEGGGVAGLKGLLQLAGEVLVLQLGGQLFQLHTFAADFLFQLVQELV